ncbi:MAG: preprotein translocase subunit SecG [Holosporales bacterium]|jgi:preprotein translocase subunit SecG|nr:preprotein translocase subunit SecG [Holosporales bacterium]
MGILLAIHVLVTLFLILIVLIQKTEGGSSLFASGGSGNMFSARGASNMLTKATWVLASLFLANCVLMAVLASRDIENSQTILKTNSSSRQQGQKTERGSPDNPPPQGQPTKNTKSK